VVTLEGEVVEADGTFSSCGEGRSGIMLADIPYFKERGEMHEM
jgi:hypothetical protein